MPPIVLRGYLFFLLVLLFQDAETDS
jgi:hypothetical protein